MPLMAGAVVPLKNTVPELVKPASSARFCAFVPVKIKFMAVVNAPLLAKSPLTCTLPGAVQLPLTARLKKELMPMRFFPVPASVTLLLDGVKIPLFVQLPDAVSANVAASSVAFVAMSRSPAMMVAPRSDFEFVPPLDRINWP